MTHIFDIPIELFLFILSHRKNGITVADLFNFSHTCKYFRRAFCQAFLWGHRLVFKNITQLHEILELDNFAVYDIRGIKIKDEKLLQRIINVSRVLWFDSPKSQYITNHSDIDQIDFHFDTKNPFDTFFVRNEKNLCIHLTHPVVDGHQSNHKIIWKTECKKIIREYISFLKIFVSNEGPKNLLVGQFLSFRLVKMSHFASKLITEILKDDVSEESKGKFLQILNNNAAHDINSFKHMQFYSKYISLQDIPIRINEETLWDIDAIVNTFPNVKFSFCVASGNIDLLIKLSHMMNYFNPANLFIVFFFNIKYDDLIKFERRCNPDSFIKIMVQQTAYPEIENIRVLPFINIVNIPPLERIRWFSPIKKKLEYIDYVYDFIEFEKFDHETKNIILGQRFFSYGIDKNVIIWIYEKNKQLLANNLVLREEILEHIFGSSSYLKIFKWFIKNFTINNPRNDRIVWNIDCIKFLLKYKVCHFRCDFHFEEDVNNIISYMLNNKINMQVYFDINEVFWDHQIDEKLLNTMQENNQLKYLCKPELNPVNNSVTIKKIKWLHNNGYFTRSFDASIKKLEPFFRWKNEDIININWSELLLFGINTEEDMEIIQIFFAEGIYFPVDSFPDYICINLSNDNWRECLFYEEIMEIILQLPLCTKRTYFIISLTMLQKTSSEQKLAKILFQNPNYIGQFLFKPDIFNFSYHEQFLDHYTKLISASDEEVHKQNQIKIIESYFTSFLEYLEVHRNDVQIQMTIMHLINKFNYKSEMDRLVSNFDLVREWWTLINQ